MESKLESASFVAPFILALFHLPPPLNHRCENVLFWSFVGVISCVPRPHSPQTVPAKTDSCTADRAPQPAKLFDNVFGQVRTATKRAGGVTRNHGGSAGRRLGVKKFTGEASIYNMNTALHVLTRVSFFRRVCYPREYHCSSARVAVSPWTARTSRRVGPRSSDFRLCCRY